MNERWSNLQLAFSIFWNSNPATASWVIALTVIEGLTPLALVFTTQFVVTTYNSGVSFKEWVSGPALVFFGILIAKHIINLIGNWVQIYHESSLSDYLDSRIQEKSATADMIAFESPDFHDRLYRAGFESEDHVLEIVEKLVFLISGGTTLIGLFWVVSQFGWWLPLLFCAASIPIFATLILQAHSKYQWSKSMTQTQRESRYYNWLLLGDEAAGEIRIFGLKDYFQTKYKKLRKKVLKSKLKLHQSQSIKTSFANILSMGLLAFGMVIILQRFQSGDISMGEAALFAHSAMLCLTSVKSIVGESAGLYRSALFLTDLHFILKLEPQITKPSNPASLTQIKNMGIECRNVTFTYPDSTNPALNGINLNIPAQKITLLFGENGSGKSTLSKLICRFFDPDHGTITLGDVDLKQFDPEKLRSQIGVIFQDPVRYYFSAKENITLGNIHEQFSESAFSKATEDAQLGQVLDDLPEAERTKLGRWFEDGTQLSCGQWQRLALGRLTYSNRPIMILDEPTSAMDPWTEKLWLQSLKKSAEGKTVLIITHRLSTAQIADHVIVLKHGKVAESGTVEHLKKSKGYFASIDQNSSST